MSCPHSKLTSASPSNCSQCLGVVARVVRTEESKIVSGDLATKVRHVTDGSVRRLFTPVSEEMNYGNSGSYARRQRRRRRRARTV